MGDIHGNLDAYYQCIERSGFNKQKDTLIQVGDVSDRHQHTCEVVEELLQIPYLIAIRGNHDDWTRNWMNERRSELRWLENGGYATVQSYERKGHSVDLDAHKAFFNSTQVDFYVDAQNRLFIHAGFVNPNGPQFEPDPSVCYLDRSLWRNAVENLNMNKPALLNNFSEIYLGHTPTLNWQTTLPMNAFNAWNIDTGAGTTGKLTIMDVNTKEYWQSDSF